MLSGYVKLAVGYSIWSPGEGSGERHTFRKPLSYNNFDIFSLDEITYNSIIWT